jgi:hypothetical protein
MDLPQFNFNLTPLTVLVLVSIASAHYHRTNNDDKNN